MKEPYRFNCSHFTTLEFWFFGGVEIPKTHFLDKQKYLNGRTVSYKISEKLKTEYPQIPNKEFKTLLNSKL